MKKRWTLGKDAEEWVRRHNAQAFHASTGTTDDEPPSIEALLMAFGSVWYKAGVKASAEWLAGPNVDSARLAKEMEQALLKGEPTRLL